MLRLRVAFQRIGGPYSVTWFAFWVTLTLNVLHHFLGSPDVSGLWGLRLFGVLMSQAAMFGVLLIAKVTVLRGVATRPKPWTTLACFALAGLARSVVLLAVLSIHLDLTTTQVAQRLMQGPIPFTAYLAVTAYLVDLFQQNKRTLADSAANQAALVSARERAEEVLSSQGSDGIEEVRAEIARHLDAAGSASLTPEHLDAFLDDTLRPMSHRLAAGVQAWSPPSAAVVDPVLGLRPVVDAIGIDRPFSPGVQASLSLAPTVGIIVVLPFGRFLLVMLLVFVSPWLMLSVGNRLLRRVTPRTPLLVRIGAVVGWTVVSAVVVALVWGMAMIGTPFVMVGITYGLFTTVLLGAATVTAKAALTAQRTLDSELKASRKHLRWEVVRVRQMQWRQQQHLARALHGPVQAAVIQTAAGWAEEDVFAVRQRLIEALDQALAVGVTPQNLDGVLSEVRQSWGRICEVRGHVEPEAVAADGDVLAMACLSDVLHEAVSNAVRHGGAHAVGISVAAHQDALQVTVIDDGAITSGRRTAGLGSRMMDDCCLAWDLETAQSGTRLTAVLPVRFGLPVLHGVHEVAVRS